jgi:hypothetical protein
MNCNDQHGDIDHPVHCFKRNHGGAPFPAGLEGTAAHPTIYYSTKYSIPECKLVDVPFFALLLNGRIKKARY